jgi:hypothetical protein
MYPLYSTTEIGVGALLGGPLVTGWLMAVNYRRLGQPRRAVATCVGAVLVTIGVGVLASHMDPLSLPLPMLVAEILIQYALQGGAVRAHFARHGRTAPRRESLRVRVVSLALLLVPYIFVFTMVAPSPDARALKVGKCQVLYRDGAIPSEANDLCTELNATGSFGASDFTVQLAHAHGRVTVEFVVDPSRLAGAERDATRDAHRLAASLSSKIFHDQPVDIFFDDDHLEHRLSVPWEPHFDLWR